MSGSDEAPLPKSYPDPDQVGWIREEDLELDGLHIRMTITPGDRIVQLWELGPEGPVRWMGNVFRIDAEPPAIYLNYAFEKAMKRARREALVLEAAKFWKT